MKNVTTASRPGDHGERRASAARRVVLCAGMLAALAIVAPGSADAQQGGGTGMSLGRYAVEIIVFRNLDQRGNTPEAPVPRAELPLAGVPVGESLPPAGGGWPALEATALELAPLAARLRKSGAYQVLYHGGWVQPVERQERAVASPLPADAAGSGARGSITLYRERYLHALVDIGLQTADGAVDDLQRIRQGRRLRGQGIQYFDNPALGVIVAARPLDGGVAAEQEPAPESTGD